MGDSKQSKNIMPNTTKKPTLKASDLSYFTGTEKYWKSPVPWQPFVYTDGVQYVASHAEAYWLLDAIASWQTEERIKGNPSLQDIQFWTLNVNEDQSAALVCERDRGDVVVVQQIKYTDFPLPQIKFYLRYMLHYWQYDPSEGPRRIQHYGVLILPSEN
jgi:hypothetical protein